MRGVVCLGILPLVSAILFVACSDSGNEGEPDDGSPAAGGDTSSGSGGMAGSAQGGEGAEASTGGESGGGSTEPGAGGAGDGGGSNGAGGSAGDGGSAGSIDGSAGSNGGEGGGGGFAPPGAILFSEDFEDGNYDGWTVPNFTHTASIVSDTGADGTTHSLLLTASNTSADFQGLYRTFSNLKPTYVSYWLFCDDPEGTKVALSGTSPNVTPISIILWGGSDTIYASGGAVLVQGGAPAWHRIEIRIDWDNATHDSYGDGILREEGAPFYYGTSTSLGRMDFSHFGDGACHLDQIEFRE